MDTAFHFPKLKSTSKTDSIKQKRQRTFSNDDNLTLKSSCVTKNFSSHLFQIPGQTKFKYQSKSPAYFKKRQPSLAIVNEKLKNHQQSIQQCLNWHKKAFQKQSLIQIAQKKLKFDFNYKVKTKSNQFLNPYKAYQSLDRPFKQSNYEKFPKPKIQISKTITANINYKEKPLPIRSIILKF